MWTARGRNKYITKYRGRAVKETTWSLLADGGAEGKSTGEPAGSGNETRETPAAAQTNES